MVEFRRLAALLWFPFFFVGVLALLLLTSFTSPTPHGVRLEVAGTGAQDSQVAQVLDRVQSGGFDLTAESVAAARADVTTGAVAGAVDVAGARIFVASGSGAQRASYLRGVLATSCKVASGRDCVVTDVAPVVSGDHSGQSLTFLGLPLLLVGLITCVVLAQFPMWALRFKLGTIAAAGGFGTIFTFLVASSLEVIPNDYWLLLYGFMLTQVIGLICLGLMPFVRRFFFPVAVTFALVVGIPSSGGPVTGDMLPGFVGWLNTFMPFAKFIDLARDTAYLGNNGLVGPLLALCGWLVGAVLLVVGGGVFVRARHRAEERRLVELEATPVVQSPDGPRGSLFGTVRTNTGTPILGARVVVLDEQGDETARALTDENGDYRLSEVTLGLHHLVVSALHCEPVIVPIALHPSRPNVRRDVLLLDWSDPAGNLLLIGPRPELEGATD